MAGYWANETATKETLRNGWLHTGDLGYVDSDGYLYVLGRSKSLLIDEDVWCEWASNEEELREILAHLEPFDVHPESKWF